MNKSENTKTTPSASHAGEGDIAVDQQQTHLSTNMNSINKSMTTLNRRALWRSGAMDIDVVNMQPLAQQGHDQPQQSYDDDASSTSEMEIPISTPVVSPTTQKRLSVSSPAAGASASRMSLPEPLSRPNKRQLRWRSRSLSNLFIDTIPPCKIQKQRSDTSLGGSSSIFASPPPPPPPFNASCLRRKVKKRFSHSASNITVTPALSATNSPSSVVTPVNTSITTSKSSSISMPPVLPQIVQPASTYALQPPPVNSASLREIDLQEIFKNPQLRHDIVFDPQLQFRPNLDGERGRRKRAVAEKYWETIIVELTEILLTQRSGKAVRDTHDSRLPLLFTTLKEILMSLLPTKDRPYADTVLDSDLIIQQLNRGSLDFLALAKWLAFVFKAHCAPMRDNWADQMVARIEMGIETNSPKRLVEGLRMVFAILEAMKLDVANHQIRTLRPILVNSAVEFEQEYYALYVERRKIDLSDSMKWFSQSVAQFEKEAPNFSANCNNQDKHRQAFVYGMLKLITCSGNDIVSEFPSTFGFDFSRLSSFRAELRKIVCLHFCVLLYQQLISQQRRQMKKPIGGETEGHLSTETVDKLKKDILAIIGDGMGNAKWTKNTSALGLEISKRAYNAANQSNDKAAPTSMSDFATGWLCKQLQPGSDLYALLEKRARESIFQSITKNLSNFCALDSTTLNSTEPHSGNVFVESECVSLASRMIVLSRFHWAAFGKNYVSFYNKERGLQQSDDNTTINGETTPMVIDENPSVKVSQEMKKKVDMKSVRVPSTNTCQ